MAVGVLHPRPSPRRVLAALNYCLYGTYARSSIVLVLVLVLDSIAFEYDYEYDYEYEYEHEHEHEHEYEHRYAEHEHEREFSFPAPVSQSLNYPEAPEGACRMESLCEPLNW